VDQENRRSGTEGATLLGQAVQAYRAALEIFSLRADPTTWAVTQGALGSALQSQGVRIGGPQALALLEQSAQAFRAALEVFTKADYPQDWATTQHNMGNTLEDRGERLGGAEGRAFGPGSASLKGSPGGTH
jgi:hypothetical protein